MYSKFVWKGVRVEWGDWKLKRVLDVEKLLHRVSSTRTIKQRQFALYMLLSNATRIQCHHGIDQG
jgi:hypothetical protein